MLWRDVSKQIYVGFDEIQRRAYPTTVPQNPSASTLAEVGVEPVVPVSTPATNPWETAVEQEPSDSDGDGLKEQVWTVKTRSLDVLKRNRIQQFRRKRNEGVAYGAVYTFPDGRAGTIPLEMPAQMSRITAMYIRAHRSLGEDKDFAFTSNDGKQFRLTPEQVVELGDFSVDTGQSWGKAAQAHIEAVSKLSTAKAVWDYDDDQENGGWPAIGVSS